MSDIGQNEDQQAGPWNGEIGSQEVSGLGKLLRAQREKRGLSYGQVAQVTMLRKHFLEALENEDWNKLPSSVFVRGYIKSYAKALGLDERRLLDLYEITAPVEPQPSAGIMEPERSRTGLILILISLFGAIAVTIYLLMGYYSPKIASNQVREEIHFQSQQEPSSNVQPPAPDIIEPEPLEGQGVIPAPTPPIARPEEMVTPEPLLAEREPVEEATVPGDLSMTEQTEPQATIEWLVLKGIVKARTWIRIHIDDQGPKEYTLEPGRMLEWKAKEGFYLLIGNAAGIDFDFNGKKVENLGKLGQVVSVSLPEDFKVKKPEGLI